MIPEIISMTRQCLEEGYQVLVLTNAMHPKTQQGLLALKGQL
jgi:hypothetical protein